MGSRKPFVQHEARVAAPGAGTNIAVLMNSVYYFLQHVFIIVSGDNYRLVVLHNNRILTDSHYETMRGAKIAFYKLYNRKAWKVGIRASWSHIYNPDRDWLDEKNDYLNKGSLRSFH